MSEVLMINPHPIGKRIAIALDSLGWSQADLSRKTGITRASISQFVNGRRLPSLPLLHKIARELGVTSDNLITGDAMPSGDMQADRIFWCSYGQLTDKQKHFMQKQLELLQELEEYENLNRYGN